MPRLSTLRPSIGALPPRLGHAPGDEKAADRQRSHYPWRQWYKTARWQKLRQRILLRDGYVCQKTGVLCADPHPSPRSPVVDHIKAHQGNAFLFWDEANLQTVSKEYHDSVKKAEENKSPHW